MSRITKNDKAWTNLFDKYEILDNVERDGFFEITSEQINEFREARLMTKFDHIANLPKVFGKNDLSILPKTRGNYVIGHFANYQKVQYAKVDKNVVNFPAEIESIDPLDLYSESAALHCACITGILNDVLEEECIPTISGRMGTGNFTFKIKNMISENKYDILVENSQCEIDGGFESFNKLALIEAKNFAVDDFLIRQLYYPYRLWQGKVSKEVVPIFMTYSNDTFSFFVYKFSNCDEYNSIELVCQKDYIIAPEQITLNDIYNVLQNTNIVTEPEVPFPQADSFARVIDLLGLLMENEILSADEITSNYSFDRRQTDYYANACRYLGLVEKKRQDGETVFYLTSSGKQIMSLNHKQKNLELVRCILEHEVFNKTLREYLNKASPLSRNEIIQIMNNSHLYNVSSQNTVGRRAQTVLKWIEWILRLQN